MLASSRADAHASVGLSFVLVATAALSSACTSLGPVPVTTAVSAVPAARPSVDLQVGIAPGFHLSSAVLDEPDGAGIRQAVAVLEPDRLLRLPGLLLGARLYGSENDAAVEPVIGYRRTLGAHRRVAVAALAFGTHSSATINESSYEATRVGGELGADLNVVGENRWVELHVLGRASAIAVFAEGSYCLDPAGVYGVDCPNPPKMANRTYATASGVFPAATAEIALDVARHRAIPFHGARIALLGTVGTMPRVVAGEQEGVHTYAAIGLTMSLAFGAAR